MRTLALLGLLSVVSLLRPETGYRNGYQHPSQISGDLIGLECRPNLRVSASLFAGTSSVPAVLVLVGGQGMDGSQDTRGMTDSPFWQEWSQKTGIAVVGVKFTGDYKDSTLGSGQALLSVLEDLALHSNHPEIATAPLVLAGFSNGGYFALTFAAQYPSRVLGFSVNKSGYAKAPMSTELLSIPGLLIKGSQEAHDGIPSVIDALTQAGQKAGAPWVEMADWGVGHEWGDVDPLLSQWVINLRM